MLQIYKNVVNYNAILHCQIEKKNLKMQCSLCIWCLSLIKILITKAISNNLNVNIMRLKKLQCMTSFFGIFKKIYCDEWVYSSHVNQSQLIDNLLKKDTCTPITSTYNLF